MAGRRKRDFAQKTSEELIIEDLTPIVEERLRTQKWQVEDAQQTKKMSKKDKARIQHRRQEELKIAVLEERKKQIEDEKRRLEEEKKAAIEKEKRDYIEQQARIDLLETSIKYFKKLRKKFLKHEKQEIEQKEWQQYLKCDGLPDPSNCGEMNTFLHLWDKVKEETTIEDACQKTEQVVSLLETLQEFIECPAATTRQRDDWITIRNSFREYQQYNLDCAAYRLLRDVTDKLNRVNTATATYTCQHDVFTICLWALVQLPIPYPNPKKPPRPKTELEFPELHCHVSFPTSIDVWALCVRVMYVRYDHYSHLCKNATPPPIPPELLMSLNEVTQIEWEQKLVAKRDIRERAKKEIEENIRQAYNAYQDNSENPDLIKAYKEAIRKRDDYVAVDASSIYCNIEDNLYITYRESMQVFLYKHIINLRKYRIIGGVYFLNLFYQPPQPTTMVLNEITLCTLQVPKWLLEVPFNYKYKPPPPPEPGVTRKPEEIEEEIKRQEIEFQQMISVSLSLTSKVLWLDVPVVCQWDSEQNIWSTENIHDAKHNEEKQTIQFKTGKFGPFAMAVYRYSSMPFQAWELKPTAQGTVVFTIMASVLIIEFTIKESMICVSQLQNAPNDSLDYVVGVYYKYPKLKRLLQNGGVDIFPESDAFCYIEGACEKQWPVENHFYPQMALFSLFYNFAWSRWNLLAGRRKLVMQMRDYPCGERAKIGPYNMLMVTPIKALFINCTEVSQTFNEHGIAKSKFYPDLYHFVMGSASIIIRKKIEKASIDVVNAVANLLLDTRVLSLS